MEQDASHTDGAPPTGGGGQARAQGQPGRPPPPPPRSEEEGGGEGTRHTPGAAGGGDGAQRGGADWTTPATLPPSCAYYVSYVSPAAAAAAAAAPATPAPAEPPLPSAPPLQETLPRGRAINKAHPYSGVKQSGVPQNQPCGFALRWENTIVRVEAPIFEVHGEAPKGRAEYRVFEGTSAKPLISGGFPTWGEKRPFGAEGWEKNVAELTERVVREQDLDYLRREGLVFGCVAACKLFSFLLLGYDWFAPTLMHMATGRFTLGDAQLRWAERVLVEVATCGCQAEVLGQTIAHLPFLNAAFHAQNYLHRAARLVTTRTVVFTWNREAMCQQVSNGRFKHCLLSRDRYGVHGWIVCGLHVLKLALVYGQGPGTMDKVDGRCIVYSLQSGRELISQGFLIPRVPGLRLRAEVIRHISYLHVPGTSRPPALRVFEMMKILFLLGLPPGAIAGECLLDLLSFIMGRAPHPWVVEAFRYLTSLVQLRRLLISEFGPALAKDAVENDPSVSDGEPAVAREQRWTRYALVAPITSKRLPLPLAYGPAAGQQLLVPLPGPLPAAASAPAVPPPAPLPAAPAEDEDLDDADGDGAEEAVASAWDLYHVALAEPYHNLAKEMAAPVGASVASPMWVPPQGPDAEELWRASDGGVNIYARRCVPGGSTVSPRIALLLHGPGGVLNAALCTLVINVLPPHEIGVVARVLDGGKLHVSVLQAESGRPFRLLLDRWRRTLPPVSQPQPLPPHEYEDLWRPPTYQQLSQWCEEQRREDVPFAALTATLKTLLQLRMYPNGSEEKMATDIMKGIAGKLTAGFVLTGNRAAGLGLGLPHEPFLPAEVIALTFATGDIRLQLHPGWGWSFEGGPPKTEGNEAMWHDLLTHACLKLGPYLPEELRERVQTLLMAKKFKTTANWTVKGGSRDNLALIAHDTCLRLSREKPDFRVPKGLEDFATAIADAKACRKPAPVWGRPVGPCQGSGNSSKRKPLGPQQLPGGSLPKKPTG